MSAGQPSAECAYCRQPGIEVDCTGRTCCKDCWADMRNWTPEKQAELDCLTEKVRAKLDREIPAILAENGLPPGAAASVCISCRKLLQVDEYGSRYCDCRNEGKLELNDPFIVPLPSRFLQ